jgi:hypothetical protein
MGLCTAISAFCVLSAVPLAADPFVGTWKLNVEKSNLGATSNVKSGSTSYELVGDGYVYDVEIVFENAKVARYMVQFSSMGLSMKRGSMDVLSSLSPKGLTRIAIS